MDNKLVKRYDKGTFLIFSSIVYMYKYFSDKSSGFSLSLIIYYLISMFGGFLLMIIGSQLIIV